MTETDSAPILKKTCVVWSRRKERRISLRIYYDVREQDGCKIYAIDHVDET